MKPDQKIMSMIKEHCKTLKLSIMEKTIDDFVSQATAENTPLSIALEKLLALEVTAATNRRIHYRMRESKLIQKKLLAEFDFDFQTGVDKAQIMELATLGFVSRKQGLIIGGQSGTGKSHIAQSLLLLGCQQCYRCLYTTASAMLKHLLSSLADNSLDQKLRIYTTPQVLLIDELGFDRLEQESSRNAALFFKVIDGRYCKSSTIITTNIDFKDLGDYLGDPTITTAIVDRMVHHSIVITINGPSWRMHESKKINTKSINKKK